MRRKRAAEADPYRPDMTPMIDLVFNLIVFFLVVSELSDSSLVPIELAIATEATEPKKGTEILQLNVLSDGVVSVGGRGYTAGQAPGAPGPRPALRLLLDREVAGRPREATEGAGLGPSSLRVNLRVDGATPFGEVQRVISDCDEADVYRLSFAADPLGPPAGDP
ncbi:MAG: biopolymer transporter ExbD [Planctomycetes bacterium]|nr:biopolymer transporter ExbD [Planctomycetota bacterium]